MRQETIHDYVCGWADRQPDAPAIVSENRLPLTYEALAELAGRFRQSLNATGYGRNDRIGVVHPGGAGMAATLVGIWSCATAIPLNPDYTVGEFAIYFRDLGLDGVLLHRDLEPPARVAAEKLGLPILEVADGGDEATGMEIVPQGTKRGPSRSGPAHSDDLVTVLGTSGTTSYSKMVPLRHKELVEKCTNTARAFELSSADRCLNLMPLFHGHGIHSGIIAPLISGGSTIVMQRFDVKTFARYVETLEPTWYTGAYTYHHQILVHAKKLKGVVARSSLRFARSGSGYLEATIAERLEKELRLPIIQAYATTETGIISANPLPPRTRKLGSVGLPAGGKVAIMDKDGEILSPGECGEVVVSGKHIFQGYENDSIANRAAFSGEWFHTGDEGRFDGDGYLFLTGRIKEMINRGGEKITPSEVEAALLGHPDVMEAAVFPIPHVTLGEEVAASVVTRKGVALTDEDLSSYLNDKLAGFKKPRRFVFVDSIPRGSSGRIQRRNLAEAFGLNDSVYPVRRGSVEEDRSPTLLESKLMDLWMKSLGLDSVGLHDDFFLLGGDSLQAVELFLRIEEQIGRRLPRAVLFEAGTVAEMAKRIEISSPTECLVPIQPHGDRTPFFCVHDGNGHVLNFRGLARYLPQDQPFFGIQCVGLDGRELPFTRIDDMAEHYVREIRKRQPRGPYCIGGYSFGGRVAYVMAQQLREAGQEVACLALIDTYSKRGRRRIRFREWLSRHRDGISELDASALPAYLALRFKNLAVMVKMSLRSKLFVLAWRFFESRNQPIPRLLWRPVEANEIIRRNYRPRTYDGSAVLFQAAPYAWTHPDAHTGWRELIKGALEVRSIPGRHYEILKEPHVQTLARELADCLAKAQHPERSETAVVDQLENKIPLKTSRRSNSSKTT